MGCFSVLNSVLLAVIVMWCFQLAVIAEDDVNCLQRVKDSLADPDGKLSSWSFGNSSVAFVCSFLGVRCWNDRENRVIGLELRDMMLAGKIPRELQFCHSLQTLDLSGNALFGPIPPQICTWLPYLTILDLSNNNLSGSIPSSLDNCVYMNNLILSGNQLSGNIPFQLTTLSRLAKFSVANNDLSGTVPSGFSKYDKSDFDGNNGLCGGPLKKCGGLSKKSLTIIIAAGVFGAAASLLLGFGWWWWYFVRSSRRKVGYGIGREDSGSWAERLRAHRTYKAVLPDGSALAVKRLSSCKLS